MSGIALILRRDGGPVARRAFAAVVGALDHRGPEGKSVCWLGPAALGHQRFATVPEDLGAAQPASDPAAGVHALFDGRLDDREGLADALGLPGEERRAPDARLVLAAYLRWGEECFERLLGPFAAAIYDARRRRVVCGRDALGSRTLFYHLDRERFLLASEERALLAHPAVSARLNEATLARFYAVAAPRPGDTFFADVHELPPATGLAVGAAGVRCWRHWRPEPAGRLRYRTDGEYAEHFRELLAASVRCRLRTVGPPAVLMSGGLDSTAVAALAARELAARGSERPLTTLSWVFDELPGADEREYMDAMAEAWGLDAVRIGGDDAWPLSNLASWPRNLNAPLEGVYRRLVERSYRAAGERGIAVVLTGDYGNHLDAGSAYWLRDLVRDGRLAAAGGAALAELVFEPRRFVRAAARALGRRRGGPPEPSWLTPGGRALAGGRGEAGGGLTAARLRSLLDPRGAQAVSLEVANAARAGIEVRRPFRDRRLVEMALALPAHQLYRPGRDRWLLRRAMAGIVPETVRLRRKRTTLLPLCARGLVEREADAVRALLAPARALWRRFVRSDWLAATFPERIRAGLDGVESVVPWRCICGELWRDGLAAAGLAPDGSSSIPIPTTTTGASR